MTVMITTAISNYHCHCYQSRRLTKCRHVLCLFKTTSPKRHRSRVRLSVRVPGDGDRRRRGRRSLGSLDPLSILEQRRRPCLVRSRHPQLRNDADRNHSIYTRRTSKTLPRQGLVFLVRSHRRRDGDQQRSRPAAASRRHRDTAAVSRRIRRMRLLVRVLRLPLQTQVALDPVSAAYGATSCVAFVRRGLAARRSEVRFAAPLVLRHEERPLEEVLLAVDVLGDGVRRVVATAEAGPLLGAQATAAVSPTGVGTYTSNSEDRYMQCFIHACYGKFPPQKKKNSKCPPKIFSQN